MFQSYHRLAPPDSDPMATDCDPRPTVDALFADWKAMGRIASQSLDQAERAIAAYSTVLDAYRDLWLALRDQDARVAELAAQNTELLGQLDAATGHMLAAQLQARRKPTPMTIEPLRVVDYREPLYGEAAL